LPTSAFAQSSIIVSIAPIGVVSQRMSKIAGEPPRRPRPGAASWEITTPESVSAACWTTLRRGSPGHEAESGIEMNSTGTRPAQSITFWLVS